MSKTNGAANKVTFSKFDRAASGEEYSTADVLRGGIKVGTITRTVAWNFKSVSSRTLVATVTGYEFDAPGYEGFERIVSKAVTAADALAAVRECARSMFAG